MLKFFPWKPTLKLDFDSESRGWTGIILEIGVFGLRSRRYVARSSTAVSEETIPISHHRKGNELSFSSQPQ
ncbi:hypothetical protein R1flu_002740 [Riccia fluitans]|uniref:Uncharacterized protein n=1 Tax=Riccia fluitans TaxID=41844 RepID=A0ABD1Y7H9_9MARC